MIGALIFVVTLLLVVPAALLGHWIGYNGARKIDQWITGRPSDKEVARRLAMLRRDEVERTLARHEVLKRAWQPEP